jgi:hypothetical protein
MIVNPGASTGGLEKRYDMLQLEAPACEGGAQFWIPDPIEKTVTGGERYFGIFLSGRGAGRSGESESELEFGGEKIR